MTMILNNLLVRVGLAKGDQSAPGKTSILSIDPAGSVIEVGARGIPAQVTAKPSSLPANAGEHLQNEADETPPESAIADRKERFRRNID
tara:strand:+ start:419674 stop:419940 length:267 start_codon:yes stop_codon:yes gene_type:complete